MESVTIINIKKCKSCGDFRRIYITQSGYKQRLFMEGDEYHKKISVVQETLLETLAEFNIGYEAIEEEIECEFSCD